MGIRNVVREKNGGRGAWGRGFFRKIGFSHFVFVGDATQVMIKNTSGPSCPSPDPHKYPEKRVEETLVSVDLSHAATLDPQRSITTKVSYHQLPSVMLSQVLYCPHGPGTPAMLLCEPPTERTSIWPSALTLLTVLHRRRALRLQRKDAVEYPVFCTINSTGERTFYSRTGS